MSDIAAAEARGRVDGLVDIALYYRERADAAEARSAKLREAMERETQWLSQPNGLHEYGRGGIHKVPGCMACAMLARLRALLAEPTEAEHGR